MSLTPDGFIPLDFQRLAEDEMLRRAHRFYAEMNRRRTTRHFSDEPVPRELIELAIRTAGTAPSGAHQQPWTFVVISDPEIKRMMREAAEEEERVNYDGRMPPEWLQALAPLGTDAVKEHITAAPYVVVLFRQVYGLREDGSHRTHYYTTESCGIAAGLFIAAIHQMGLATLTHTPSPMGFLTRLLRRPENEKPFLLMPVGFPAPDARVPDLHRKPLEQIAVWFDAAATSGGGLTAAELAEIQARCDRATPGPWTSYVEGRDHQSGSSFIMTAGDDINPVWMSDEDQDFAAHARQDIPRLLDEVRRLSAGGADADGGVDAAELAQMQRRCDAASPGPWRASLKGPTPHGPESVVATSAGASFELCGVTEDDHAFIAHARHDLPRLLAEVHRLRQAQGMEAGQSPDPEQER